MYLYIMTIPEIIDINEISREMLDVIINGENIDMWIEDKIKNIKSSNIEGDNIMNQWIDDLESKSEEPTINDCQRKYYKYIRNIAQLERQKKILEDYKKYISSDIKNYGTNDAENSTNIHQMKALYTSQYTILIKFWIKRFRIIYYLILLCYIGLLVKNRKYKSKPHIAIAILLCAYPLVINHIIIALLKGMETIFSYTPANAYRNLYNQNINKLEKDDIYLHYTQIPL